jgi:uncharacterized protein (TIGR03435 family)
MRFNGGQTLKERGGGIMRKALRILVACCFIAAASAAFAQSKTEFEVASVKPAPPLDMSKMAAAMQSGQMPSIGAHVNEQDARYSYMTLKQLIAIAYSVKAYQITAPDWMGTARFDIIAKLPDGASKDDAPQMLQALLADRFKLAIHRDSKEEPVLALVVSKGGPKMKESTDTPQPLDEDAPLQPGEMKMDTPNGPARMSIGKNGTATMNMGTKGTMTYKVDPATQAIHMDASSLTMAGLADMLTQFSQMGGAGGRPIVDKTDLKGNYQVAMDFPISDLLNMARASGIMGPGMGRGPMAPSTGEASEPSGTSTLNEAVETLGMRLEPRNDVVQGVVVDHAEKTPTEN